MTSPLRRPVVVASAVAAAVVLFGVVAIVAAEVTERRRPSAQAIEAFERAVVDEVRAAGQTVELGLKVAVGDLGAEHVTAPDVIAEQTTAWRADLVAAKRAFEQVEPPRGLGDARRRFVASLDHYLHALELIREATRAPESERSALLDRVIEEGRRGDRLFDRGSAALQAARRRAGLAPSPHFPDPDDRS